MFPKSMIEDRRFRRQYLGAWLAIVAATVSMGWFYHSLSKEQSAALLGVAICMIAALCGVCALLMVVAWGFTTPYDLQKHREKFVEAFGNEPDGDKSVVQQIVSLVLEGLRRRAQGAFGREIGAQREHADHPSDESVEKLNRAKEESGRLKKKFWDAANSANDWGYNTPKSIDEPAI